MRDRALPLLLAALLAAWALSPANGPAPDATAPGGIPAAGGAPGAGAHPGAAAGQPGPDADSDALSVLHADFAALEGRPMADAGRAGAGGAPPERQPVTVAEAERGLARAGYLRRDSLIVLVPDPLESSVPNNFDFALDAIRRAHAAHGYLPDRASLPWVGEDGRDRRYRKTPGILLFRRGGAGGRRLASVLLVGERPKTGIHQEAFAAAVRMLRRRGEGTTAGRPLRILGPSFSGSAESLRLALARSPSVQAEIVSGTATAADLATAFGRRPSAAPTPEGATAEAGAGRGAGATGGAVSFCRTVLPDPVLQAAAFDFFDRTLGWNPRRMALLVEEDTAYGGRAAEASSRGPSPLSVRFPSGLTEVRKLWESSRRSAGAAAAAAPAAGAPGVPATASDVSLADATTPAEVGAEFDPVTARTKELMIANLLEEIPRHGVRYVGVLATDIRDKLYLTERVRGFAPGAVLFAFENHLVQAHPRFIRPFRPVLLVGNFATATEHRPWTPERDASVRQFGSEFHQGIYRAAELLVARQAGEAPEPAAPRVWVTVTARGAILPVAEIPAQGTQGAALCREEAAAGIERPRLPSLGAAGYLVIGLAIATLLALALSLQWAAPPGGGGNAALLVALGAGGVSLPALALFLIAFYPGFTQEFALQRPPLLVVGLWTAVLTPFAGLTTLFVVTSARLIATCGTDVVASVRRAAAELRGAVPEVRRAVAGPAGERRRAAGVAAAAPGRAASRVAAALGRLAVPVTPVVLGAFLIWGLWAADTADSGWYRTYLHLRARHPLSGVSPLPPLVAVGLAAWTWARLEMQRLRQRLRFETGWPFPRSADPVLAGCEELARRVDERTAELLPGSAQLWTVLLLALLVPVASLLRAMQPIVEPRAYGWVFFLLLFVPFVLAAVSFLRFVRVWRRLEQLLDRFDQSELQTALSAVGKEAGWKPVGSFSWRMPVHRLLVLSAQKLKAVEERSTVEISGEGTVGLDALLADYFAVEQAGSLERELAVRRKLRRAFAAAVERLAGETGGQGQDETRRQAIAAFLAARLVAYLRAVFLHLRQSLIAAVGTWLFLLLGVSTYAFEPKRWVSIGLWLAIAAASVVTLRTFVQMDRNAVLSRISGGEAGKLEVNRTFVVNALTYSLAPLTAVVLAVFPELGRYFGRWTDPLLRLLGE